ncbi:MAG TPA: magnesium transporter [Candidatus Nanoarchaeia archaeon]|nr:magnesium transporter [Candidatus Nanoarchaeia archaeon]
MEYKAGSAGRHAISEIVKVKRDSAIRDVLRLLSKEGNRFKIIDPIYIVDKGEKLVGVVSIRDMFSYPQETKVGRIMKKKVVSLSPDAEDEKAAHVALKYGIKTIPVVKNRKILGAIPANLITSILNRSLQEDILHFAGIHKSHLNYENTTKVPLLASVLHRLPWLIVGLIGIMIAAYFINIFESTLQTYLILAFFIPAIVYMSDALGTQHQTLFVRDLATLGKDLNLGQYFLKQTVIAGILAVLISSLTMVGIFLFWNAPFTGFVISISLFIALMVTNFTSLVTTLIIYKMGHDPALGSGPLATVISDLTSIVIYFLIASWLLL